MLKLNVSLFANQNNAKNESDCHMEENSSWQNILQNLSPFKQCSFIFRSRYRSFMPQKIILINPRPKLRLGENHPRVEHLYHYTDMITYYFLDPK